MVQIAVATSLGLTPVSRARSALVAAARTASPKWVCPSNHQSPTVMIGTTMMASSSGPVTVMLWTRNGPIPKLPISQCEVIGLG